MRRTLSICGIALSLGILACGFIQSVSGADSIQLLSSLMAKIDQAPNVAASTKALMKEKLLPFCTDSVFVAAVKAQNSKRLSLDAIKKTDSAWIFADDDLPIKRELTGNAVTAEIQRLGLRIPSMSEVIVMDNQGANVGQNTLTTDYWQGDEPKFINAFNSGKGGVDFGKARLDKSTNRVDQKISLPIIDTDGKVIGAICIGLVV
ncbi:MAG: hypothetical protein WAU88_07860 [Candidatus Zixiibacteriota bacterium]